MTGPQAIGSRDNPLLVRLRKLARGTAYRKQGLVWLEGEHLCEAYLARGSGAGVQAVIGESGWENAVLRRLASQAEAAVA